ncbi:MAG: A/G-specific adenine glycosylase [Thermodesulfobacteriota bacterium]|nr:A/G-specific adenine glycosylase [Thermodesulfobacteriota bacterium]
MVKSKKRTSHSCSRDGQEIGKKLVSWFLKNQRPLPWRRDYDPYAVWISEVMLQQTQVSKVVPYFNRWMKLFPDPVAVAEADEDLLLLLWEGLGYYSRVRNIKKAAGQIVQEHNGRIPREEKALQTLPGIGGYTAAAILSLAFNEDVAALDGNGKRVVARMRDMDQPVNTSESMKAMKQTLNTWLPRGQSREFNQAIMELGATVCTPLRPQCEICPVSAFCCAFRNGTVLDRPFQNRRTSSVKVNAAVGIFVDDGKVFIQKRPPNGLMASLWEFPGGIMEEKESPEECLRRELLEELGVHVRAVKKLPVIWHAYTKFRVRLHAYTCELCPPGQKIVLRTAVEGQWILMGELDNFAFSSANRRLIKTFRKRD